MVFTSLKNLIIVTHASRCDPRDFVDIGNRIAERAPDLRVYVVSDDNHASVLPAEMWQWKTLTIAFNYKVEAFEPKRGRVLVNHPIPKLEQQAIFKSAGIPSPQAAGFKIGEDLDPRVWGEFVLLKPASLAMTSHGAGIQLFRRARLASMRAGDFPERHLVHAHPMLVQRFIDTGLLPNKYRVLTLCGEVLYVQYSEIRIPRPPLDSPDAALESAVVDTAAEDRLYAHGDYPDVLEFGRRVAASFPENPLLGIDVIKDAETGALYALEVNGGGNVWHFSSPLWADRRRMYPDLLEKMHAQFGAFDVAARVLARAARELAE